ncbi:MAG: hypothetical protein M9919_04210 [Burkholderiaceae bacterium]|jgi:hypothetical protein|nr:EF-hand domain-containing protein [Burkholderiaceae bacterium]MCO5103191.1 hypothetical protein [Burkholderiaceae bacterium]
MTPLISGLASLASLLFNASKSGGGPAAAPRRNGESADAGPAARVRWSPQARAWASDGALQAQTPSALTRRVGRPAESAGEMDAQPAVSRQDFQQLLAGFGATELQTQQLAIRLASRFDADQNGAISQHEFQQGLARAAAQRPGDVFSQQLLDLIDAKGNADGQVDARELAALARAFARAAHAGHAG